MVNGICNKINDNINCQYDGLDCCSDLDRLMWETNYKCHLQVNGCPMDLLVNQQCDQEIDQSSCLYDMGQCCGMAQFEQSKICDTKTGEHQGRYAHHYQWYPKRRTLSKITFVVKEENL